VSGAPGRLQDKVAFITGAGSGMGREVAVTFAREGASVWATDVDEASAAETARLIVEAGGQARSARVDVGEGPEIRSAIDACAAEHGKLDILYNNAGITGEYAETAECSEENWAKTIAINLTATFLGMKYAIPHMLEGGGGSIVNVSSSGGGLSGFPRLPAYCAAKLGVVGLTQAAAIEYARRNVRVNCIAPGVVATPMMNGAYEDPKVKAIVDGFPLGRFGTVQEIAATAVFLASDEAASVIGVTIPVDGGQYAS
jgi:NAD(P)-dependent dehydrogenase (short-subunit alcohol dehydrogenase family)